MKKNNTHTTYIAVAIALVITFGAFAFLGGGFSAIPQQAGIPTDVSPEDIAALLEEQGIAPADIVLGVAINEEKGNYLIDYSGNTLYTTTKESCTGDCLTVWPPYTTDTVFSEGELGTIFLEEGGSYQYTWQGQALYHYEADLAPGDTSGHELGGVWFLARP